MTGHMPHMHGFHDDGSEEVLDKTDTSLHRSALNLFQGMGGSHFFGSDVKGDDTYDFGGLATPESKLIPNTAARLQLPGQHKKKKS